MARRTHGAVMESIFLLRIGSAMLRRLRRLSETGCWMWKGLVNVELWLWTLDPTKAIFFNG